MQGVWKTRPWDGYLRAVLITGLAILVCWALSGALVGSPYLAFYPAILVAAAWGGWGPGLLSTGASALVVVSLGEAAHGGLMEVAVLSRLALFLVSGLGISYLGAQLQAAQEHAQRQARDATELLQLADLAQVMVWDLDGRITRWSQGCQQLYGFSSQQAVGQECHGLLQTRFPEPLEAIHTRLLEAGRWQGELTQTTADGRQIVVASQWLLWWDAAGQPAGVLESNSDITARQQAEAALRRQQMLLEAVTEGVTDAVFIKDVQGRYQRLNAPAARRLGKAAQDVLGCDDAMLLGAETAAQIRAVDERVMNEGTSMTYEETCDWAGSPRSYRTTKGPLWDEQGQVVGVLGIARDLTERREAELAEQQRHRELEQRAAALAAESRQADELLHAIFEGTQDLMAAMDRDFHYIAFNQGYRDLVQRSSGVTLQKGRTLDEAVGPTEEEELLRQWWGRALQGESFTVERELADHRCYQIRFSPIRASDGTLIGAADVWRDISDRKQVEEALRQAHDELELHVRQRTAELEAASQTLRESAERFRALLDNSPTIAWAKDEQGRLVYGNRAFQRRFALCHEDWQGKTDEELWPAEIAQRFRQKDAAVLDYGETVEALDELPDGRGGCSSWWNVRFPFQDAAGVRYVGGMGVDISERRQAEEELRRMCAELELRVEQRTAELAAANRELEAFIHSVSHELRAPLRHVTSYIQLLEKKAGFLLDETACRYVRTISEAGRRLGNLMDDLLLLSRLGRVALTDAVVNLGQLVEEVRQEFASETADRMIEWHIGPLPVVHGDSALLRSVVRHLLGNALKFSRHQQPARIEVGAEIHNGEVICSVRDNGAGFDMRFVGRLFQAFQRLHRVDEFEGTGIGLASVRRIIERHGGRTWAEGAVDRGATFYFSLPVPKS